MKTLPRLAVIPVAALFLGACGDPVQPDADPLHDYAGTWEAQTYAWTADDDPALRHDRIADGGELHEMTIGHDGTFTQTWTDAAGQETTTTGTVAVQNGSLAFTNGATGTVDTFGAEIGADGGLTMTQTGAAGGQWDFGTGMGPQAAGLEAGFTRR